MGKPWKRSAEKEAYWQRTMDEWRESGLTGREFCKKRGLSEHQYYAWKRELRIRAREAELNESATEKVKDSQLTQPIFIPLTLNPEVAEDKNPVAAIEIVAGCHCIRVLPEFDSETLNRILAVIVEQAEGAK
jgi:hypothetical protein